MATFIQSDHTPVAHAGILATLRQYCFASDYAPKPVWNRLWLWLGIAFVLRAIVALGGDFVIHPDEIMQYLEPAHALVFGNGIVYWEYFYGARSWLVPGMVAGILWLSDAVGLGEPWFYVDAVKLVLCLLSLLIPWGTYHYSRRILNEPAARLALILTCIWPYLIAYAHKPMTEFVATDVFMGVLGLAALPASRHRLPAAVCGFLITLAALLRFQYAPVAMILWLAKIITLKPRSAWAMFSGSCLAMILVSLLEWYSWGGILHSYKANLLVNFALDQYREGKPFYYYVSRLLYATCGGILLAVWVMCRQPKRYLLVGTCFLMLLVTHFFLASHKEFRFLFLMLVLCLMPLAAWLTSCFERFNYMRTIVVPTCLVGVYSLSVLTNTLPFEHWLHESERSVKYLFGQGNLFQVYQSLAKLDDVTGVIHLPNPYFDTPGYYYLHHRIPFYDLSTSSIVYSRYQLGLPQFASHMVARFDIKAPNLIPLSSDGDYNLYKVFPTTNFAVFWNSFRPTIVPENIEQIARDVLGDTRKSLPLDITVTSP